MSVGWVKAVSCDDLAEKGCTVFRLDNRQIAIFSTKKGIFACNNRCPHEGYPLREGTLDEDCKLTCNWHNWKFDLETGENQRDGDRLRTYPVELRDGAVWIEIVDPPLEEQVAGALEGLKKGFDDHAYEQMSREIARIMRMGADPLVAMVKAVWWSHDRLEFGWTHAYAGAADWLALYDRHEGSPENRLICLLEAIGHMSDDTLRESTYPFAKGVLDWDEEAFVAAVEREDEDQAIRLTRGALAAGGAHLAMERGLARAALAHYADFGHSAIYVSKVASLVERLGDDVAEPLLLSLVRSLVSAFREDLIPEFRAYGSALESFGKKPNGSVPGAGDYATLGAAKAVEFTASHGRAAPLDLYRSLLGANAMNMLTFDLAHLDDINKPYGSDFGWLDLTHGLTFSDAVLRLCSRHSDLWPAGLLQMACFAGRNIGHQNPDVDLEDWRVADRAGFFGDVEAKLLDHGQDEYIVSVHLLKTAEAVRFLASSREAGHAGDVALAALNRLLHSPVRRKMVRRTARQAMRFVATDV